MTRIVRQINVAPSKRDDANARAFSDFSSEPDLVLLGDPGAGKTFTFKQSAIAEGARYLKARAFLNTPAQLFSARVLFIDGLDEKRAGRGDQDMVDAMVQKLFAVSPARVRISCRAADWLSESDLAALRPYFEQGGEARVLLLQNLSRRNSAQFSKNRALFPAGRTGFSPSWRNVGWLISWRTLRTSSCSGAR